MSGNRKKGYTEIHELYRDSSGIAYIMVMIKPDVVTIPSLEWIRENKHKWDIKT